jgi:hypothetical protein
MPDPPIRLPELVEKHDIDVLFDRQLDGVGRQAGTGGDDDLAYLAR